MASSGFRQSGILSGSAFANKTESSRLRAADRMRRLVAVTQGTSGGIMDKRTKIEKALEGGEGLPAAPAVMQKIVAVCRDAEATARDLGKVLQYDTALTNRVLKQVNSSFYGLSSTIRTVTHAVVILGFEEIKSIVLGVPVANLYKSEADSPGIDVADLWNRTVESACIARCVSYHVKHPIPEQVFVAAILSETGMVVLNSILGDDYAEVVGCCGIEDLLPYIEEDQLGISHVEVGRRLAAKWQFPPELADTIARHHDPIDEEGNFLPETGMLFVGRTLRIGIADELGFEDILEQIPDALAEAFHLDAAALEAIYAKAEKDFADARSMMNE